MAIMLIRSYMFQITQESIMLSNYISLTAPLRVIDISHDLMNPVMSSSALFLAG